MPRAPRIESSEGLYHVINRGNYRSHIFGTEGAKGSNWEGLACIRDLRSEVFG